MRFEDFIRKYFGGPSRLSNWQLRILDSDIELSVANVELHYLQENYAYDGHDIYGQRYLSGKYDYAFKVKARNVPNNVLISLNEWIYPDSLDKKDAILVQVDRSGEILKRFDIRGIFPIDIISSYTIDYYDGEGSCDIEINFSFDTYITER